MALSSANIIEKLTPILLMVAMGDKPGWDTITESAKQKLVDYILDPATAKLPLAIHKVNTEKILSKVRNAPRGPLFDRAFQKTQIILIHFAAEQILDEFITNKVSNLSSHSKKSGEYKKISDRIYQLLCHSLNFKGKLEYARTEFNLKKDLYNSLNKLNNWRNEILHRKVTKITDTQINTQRQQLSKLAQEVSP